MRRKLLTLFVWLMLLVIQSYSQSSYEGALPKVAPVSPNAAALFKSVERPVGSFTGTTPINIPLYNLTAGGLSVPVSINYNNGGIKVQEIASSVGLGWSLSAGGSITRVMNGIADDRLLGGDSGYLHMTVKPSTFPIPGWPYSNVNAGVENVSQILHGHKDAEPDLFYFSYPGGSGKFYFDEQKNIHLVDQLPIKIEPQWGSDSYEGYHITGWIIRDDKGNIYYMGDDGEGNIATDKSTLSYSSESNYAPPPPSSFYTASWHLVKMTDMNGDNAIRFYYASTSTDFSTLSAGGMPISSFNLVDCQESDNYSDVHFVENQGEESYLSLIATTQDSLVFHTSGRWDHQGGLKVDSIRLYARNGGGLRKRHHFNYSYFGSGSPTTYFWRLKLNNVAEFGSSGTDSSEYKFDYIEDINLPSHFSRGIDYWGYYNGADNNWTFFPNGVYRNMYDIGNLYISNMADRRSYGSAPQANTLKKITWPTKGYREFTYENNTVLLDMYSQIAPDPGQYNFHDFDTTDFNTTDPWEPQYRHDFTINSTSGGAAFNFGLDWNYIYGNWTVKLYRLDDYFPPEEVFTFYNDTYGQWNLLNGNYRVEVEYDPIYTSFSHFYAWYYEENVDHSTIERYGSYFYVNNNGAGGIRVKEIKDYDPVTGKTNTTKYKYNLFSDSTKTSGLLISPVIVAHVAGCTNGVRACDRERLSTVSHYPLSAEGGSYVVYPEVRTIEEGNGYTDREYSFAFDGVTLSTSMDEFPIVPWPDQSWKRGKVLWEKRYNNSGQLLHKSSILGYGFASAEWPSDDIYWLDEPHLMASSQKGYKSVGYWKIPHSLCDNTGYPEAPPCGVCWKDFEFSSHFGGIKASKETMYQPGGGNNETLTEYAYYTSLSRPLKYKETTTLSDNSKKITYYRYAFNSNSDFQLGISNADTAMKRSLRDLNYMQPLEVTSYIKQGNDSVFAGGMKLIFGTFNGSDKQPSILRQFSSLTDSSDLKFLSYDSYGNVLEQQKDNNPKEAYLWGYDYSYPVAKVVGSNYTTVAAFVDNNTLQYSYNESSIRTQLNNLRTGLAGTQAQVTTYTYKPVTGISSETDASGKTVFYEYDRFNRLMLIKDQEGKLLKRFCYQYDGQQGNCTLYGNVQKTGNYTRNNCGGGYIGSTVTYTVPANTYYDYTQAGADALAQTDVNSNGQGYANTNGTCTPVYYNVEKSGNFTKDDCGSGYTGSTETYTVPANTYSSTTSQAAADALAQNDVNTNGQNYANTYGSCTQDDITMDYTTFFYLYAPIYFTFTNLDTYQQYNFETGYYDWSYSGTFGQMPPGYYEVEIYEPYGYYRYYESCYGYTSGSTYAYMSFVYFDESCHTIDIY